MRQALRRTNVDGTRRVIEAVRRAGVAHLVAASSVGAYSPAPDDVPRREQWPTEGIRSSEYSVDKAAMERLLDEAEVLQPDLVVSRLRPALIFQKHAGAEIQRYFLGRLFPARVLGRRAAVAAVADRPAPAGRPRRRRRRGLPRGGRPPRPGCVQHRRRRRPARPGRRGPARRRQPPRGRSGAARAAVAAAWHARALPDQPGVARHGDGRPGARHVARAADARLGADHPRRARADRDGPRASPRASGEAARRCGHAVADRRPRPRLPGRRPPSVAGGPARPRTDDFRGAPSV